MLVSLQELTMKMALVRLRTMILSAKKMIFRTKLIPGAMTPRMLISLTKEPSTGSLKTLNIPNKTSTNSTKPRTLK